MFDIIIPVYKAKKTLLRLLMTIALQKNTDDFKVYMVIDSDDEDYSYEVDFVKDYFELKVLKLSKNSGPGFARQYGIDNSNNPYIMFIDADDYLYSPYALSSLMNKIKQCESDLLISNFRYERDNEVIIKKLNTIWLHGNVYKRKFLVDNDIRFNDTRANEDNGFNKLVLLNLPKIDTLDEITYVYCENANSITRKNNREYKFSGLKYFSYNYNYAMNKMIEKNKNLDLVATTALMCLLAMYFYYLEFYNQYDVDKILLWSQDSYKIYKEYLYMITLQDFNELYKIKVDEYKDKNLNMIITFDEFLKKVCEYND